MKLFLDDVRQPSTCLKYMERRIGKYVSIYNEKWEVVRNYKQFIRAIKKHASEITHVSFDHDLAEIHYDPSTWTESFKYEEETGLDCAKWMIEYYKEKELKLPKIIVHSMNPVGTRNIIKLFTGE